MDGNEKIIRGNDALLDEHGAELLVRLYFLARLEELPNRDFARLQQELAEPIVLHVRHRVDDGAFFEVNGLPSSSVVEIENPCLFAPADRSE